jgi:RNA polymerase sigma-70 factor (ECF subfamily)
VSRDHAGASFGEKAPGVPRGPTIADQDASLLERARQGDRQAFRRLVELHHRRIFNIAVRMLGDRAAAEDVVQETFLSAYEHLERFEGRARFSTWISAIAMNRCRNVMRAAAYARTDLLDRDLPGQPDRNPEAEAGAREIAVHLERALGAIAPEHREVIVLRDVEGISTNDAAAILGIEPGTVKSRLHRAREALRAKLQGVWPP